MGEFYHRLHKETHPILIMGTSLLELLTKHLQVELDLCARDAARTIDVHFARLVLTQVGKDIGISFKSLVGQLCETSDNRFNQKKYVKLSFKCYMYEFVFIQQSLCITTYDSKAKYLIDKDKKPPTFIKIIRKFRIF